MSSAVVQQLLVEVDGRTAKVEASMRAMEQKIETTMRRVSTSTAGAGTAATQAGGAAEAMGAKYARGAQAMASAAETAARAGKLTGESAKQLITQGSMMASMYGPTGMIVGAVGISIVAIANLFNRSAREAEETATRIENRFREMGRRLRDMVEAGDLEGLDRMAGRARLGDPFADTEAERLGTTGLTAQRAQLMAQVAEMQRRVDAERARLAATRPFDAARGSQWEKDRDALVQLNHQLAEHKDRLSATNAMLDEQSKRYHQIDRARSQAMGQAVDRGVSDARRDAEKEGEKAAKAAADVLIKYDKQLIKEVGEMNAKIWEDLAKRADAAMKGRLDAQSRFVALMAQTSETLTDDVRQQLDPIITQLREAGLVAEAVQLENLRDSSIQAQRHLEESAGRLAEIRRTAKGAADEYTLITGEIAQISVELGKENLQAGVRTRLQERLNELIEAQTAALGRVTHANGGVKQSADNVAASVHEVSRAIQQAVDGALQLAQALGLVDERTADVLRGAGQIAAGIGPLSRAVRSGEWDGPTGIVSSALPIIGGLASLTQALFDDGSARREEMRALQEALDRLARTIEEDRIRASLSGPAREEYDIERALERGIEEAVEAARKAGVQLPRGFENWDRERQLGYFSQRDFAGRTPAETGGFSVSVLENALNELYRTFDEAAERIRRATEAARQDLDEDLEVRRARLRGDDDEAERLALHDRLQDEIRAKQESGLYTEEQISELREVARQEEAKFAEEQAKRRDEEAQREAEARRRTIDDLQTRIGVARAGTSREADDLRRRAEQQKELEAATDPAIKKLIELAHAAEETAIAMQRARDAARDMEDFEVRRLRAEGREDEADALEFQRRQEREYEDAVRRGESEEYLAELQETLVAELARFLADRQARDTAVDDPTARASGGSRSVSSQAYSGVTSHMFDRNTEYARQTARNTALMLQRMITQSFNQNYGPPISFPAPPGYGAGFTSGGAQGPAVIQIHLGGIHVNVTGALASTSAGPQQIGQAAGEAAVRQINQSLGQSAVMRALMRGDIRA